MGAGMGSEGGLATPEEVAPTLRPVIHTSEFNITKSANAGSSLKGGGKPEQRVKEMRETVRDGKLDRAEGEKGTPILPLHELVGPRGKGFDHNNVRIRDKYGPRQGRRSAIGALREILYLIKATRTRDNLIELLREQDNFRKTEPRREARMIRSSAPRSRRYSHGPGSSIPRRCRS